MTNFSRTVLIPIDMQQAFDDRSRFNGWNSEIDGNGLSILKAWRKAKLPIIHVQHNSVVAGSVFAPEHKGNKFRAGFEPQHSEALVGKSVNAAFIGTDLELRLRRMDIRKIVSFGMTTDQCVSTTFRMGSNLGFEMTLIEDACNCFDTPDGKGGIIPALTIHQVHIATLGFEFGKVLTTADVLQQLADAV